MSWDIIVSDFPKDLTRIEDCPEDFKPAPLGTRTQIIRKIIEVIPNANFSKPAWGLVEGDGWSIEVSLGNEEICTSFAFHVRGGDAAIGIVAAILDHLELRAVDAQTSEFFVSGLSAIESFSQWRAFRDRALKQYDS